MSRGKDVSTLWLRFKSTNRIKNPNPLGNLLILFSDKSYNYKIFSLIYKD